MSKIVWPTSHSEAAELISTRDWSATPLGSLDRWPATLRTLTDVILLSRQHDPDLGQQAYPPVQRQLCPGLRKQAPACLWQTGTRRLARSQGLQRGCLRRLLCRRRAGLPRCPRAEENLRQAEAALREMNQSLERKVVLEEAERVKAEDALRQAHKMEAVGQLASGVAHDFNNVLQIISSNLQLMELDGIGSMLGARVTSAVAAVERGSKLSSQLLAFARRQPLQSVATDLGRLLADMESLLLRALGDRIVLDLRRSPGLWNARVDRNQLENAILNMEINARDAMGKQSGGQIELASVAGSGTTVTMYFPLLHGAEAGPAPAASPEPVRTVLVVEDEAPVRQVSVEVLRKLGLCVLEAADGETALGMIRQGLPIDLVFTDLPAGVTQYMGAQSKKPHQDHLVGFFI